MKKVTVLLSIALALSSLDTAHAKERKTVVAVFPLKLVWVDLSSNQAKELGKSLETTVALGDEIKVIPREAVESSIARSGLGSAEECLKQHCKLPFTGADSARKALVTEIVKLGDTCTVSTDLHDLESNTIEMIALAGGNCSWRGLLRSVELAAHDIRMFLKSSAGPDAEDQKIAHGYLSVTADPLVNVEVDGKAIGTSPIKSLRLKKGDHQVNVESPAMNSGAGRSVIIRPGRTTMLSFRFTYRN